MPYVNCPKCGAQGCAWEDEYSSTFCGKCERDYAEWNARQEAEREAVIEYQRCQEEDF